MIGSPLLHDTYNPSVKPFGFASSPYTGEPSPAGDEGQKTKRPRKGSALRGRIFFLYCTVSLPPSTPTVSRVSGARSWPMI